MNFALVVAGILLLAIGGEGVVRGALSAARRLGISPLLAGLVIVGFGTSAPELVVTVDAVLGGRPGIAIGNVVGSNIANVLLILGCCGLVAPLAVRERALRRDGVAVAAASLLFLVLAAGGLISRGNAALLLCLLLAYLVWTYLSESRHGNGTGRQRDPRGTVTWPRPLWAITVVLIGGLALLLAGSRMLLAGAVAIAEALGVGDAAIGLTLVAAGTSLPELAVCVVATVRRQSDVAIGNVLGSNLFNLLGILGVSAMLHPLPVPARMLLVDQWILAGSALLVLLFLFTGMRLSRTEGALLLTAYVGYVLASFTLLPT